MTPTRTVTDLARLTALDHDHVMATYARVPVAFVRGEGVHLWDSEGNEYLDFLGGLAVTSLGHAHPAVADAIADQARTLLHVSNLYLNGVQPLLAERIDLLLTSATGTPGRVFFANSGAEANECAIKLARRYGQLHGGPERFHILSAYNSFHGRTLTTLAATGQPQKQETFQPLPSGFRQVAFADVFIFRMRLRDIARAKRHRRNALAGEDVCVAEPVCLAPTAPRLPQHPRPRVCPFRHERRPDVVHPHGRARRPRDGCWPHRD